MKVNVEVKWYLQELQARLGGSTDIEKKERNGWEKEGEGEERREVNG